MKLVLDLLFVLVFHWGVWGAGFATSTIDHLENEDQRNWILETLPFEPVSIEGAFGSQIKEETMKDGYIQLLPGRYPCDGFFISAFRRKA